MPRVHTADSPGVHTADSPGVLSGAAGACRPRATAVFRTGPRYWVGRSNWRNVSVLMSRNIGVRGGSNAGVRKSVSKL